MRRATTILLTLTLGSGVTACSSSGKHAATDTNTNSDSSVPASCRWFPPSTAQSLNLGFTRPTAGDSNGGLNTCSYSNPAQRYSLTLTQATSEWTKGTGMSPASFVDGIAAQNKGTRTKPSGLGADAFELWDSASGNVEDLIGWTKGGNAYVIQLFAASVDRGKFEAAAKTAYAAAA